jgi:hypothetical protein
VWVVADEATSIPSRRAFTGFLMSHNSLRVAVFCGPLCRYFTRQWRWTRPGAVAARVRWEDARGQTQTVCASRCWRRRRTRVDDSWRCAHGGGEGCLWAAVRCGAVRMGCVQCATVAAIVQRSSVVDAGADAAEGDCESRWTQGVMELEMESKSRLKRSGS